MGMSVYSILSLTDSMSCFALATLLLWRGRRQAWALIVLFYVLSAWVALPFLYISVLPHASLTFVRSSYIFAVVVPTVLLLFAMITMERSFKSPLLILCAALGIFFICVLRSPLFWRTGTFTQYGF